MPFDIKTETDLASIEARARNMKSSGQPAALDVADLMAWEVAPPAMLIDGLFPGSGASLMLGAPKSNKTLLAVQMAIAVASGNPLFDYYRVLTPGPALFVEQDDPAGAASLKDILRRSPVPVAGIPFCLAPRVPFTFGLEFLEWLEAQISERALRLVVLDSYTALRGPRGAGIDIVKAEQSDLSMMDELAKRTGCALDIIHHDSKGSAARDWSNMAAGTFAMSAATEAQIHVSRFAELDSNAPERLVRVRGRHLEGTEMVLRFRKETLDHEHLSEGGAAPLYPLVLQLQSTFGTQTFGPKELCHAKRDPLDFARCPGI
jgi:RecA-family ATPase